MRKIILLIGLLSVVKVSNIYSQNFTPITLDGVIKTSLGEIASGVSISIYKKGRGTWSGSIGGIFHLEWVKPGDTILFTCIGLKNAYFVADRIYNHLTITIPIDTFLTVHSAFKSKDYLNLITNRWDKRKLRASFIEDKNPVTQVPTKKYNENEIFTKVEMMPDFMGRASMFKDSLLLKLTTIEKKYLPKKSATISMYYTITTEGKIHVNNITGNCKEEVKQLIANTFESVHKLKPGLNDGVNVKALCLINFKIEKNDGEYSLIFLDEK